MKKIHLALTYTHKGKVLWACPECGLDNEPEEEEGEGPCIHCKEVSRWNLTECLNQ